MIKVRFYDIVEDKLLRFAVIIAKTDGKWVFCRHQERDTLEFPGGHREPGETILAAARRELYEETGALDYDIRPLAVYSVTRSGEHAEESFGMLYCADIRSFEAELHSEIEAVVIAEELPDNWTYPLIQPELLTYYVSHLNGE